MRYFTRQIEFTQYKWKKLLQKKYIQCKWKFKKNTNKIYPTKWEYKTNENYTKQMQNYTIKMQNKVIQIEIYTL